MGGLGNQLFQLFTTIAYSMKNKQRFYFPNSKNLGKRYTYWDSFLKHLKDYTISDPLNKVSMQIVREKGFHYEPLSFVEGREVCLSGYFQSEKYFKEYYGVICHLIQLKEEKELVNENYPNNYSNSISMHFRLVDYKKLPDYHPILCYSYYKNSLTNIINTTNKNDWNILYFCDEEDIPRVDAVISILKSDFPSLTFERISESIVDWEQMLIMSLCTHNIIANSSFSWWGAYFNSSENKIVCYPDIWFGPRGPQDTQDLCPESWVKNKNS